MTTFSVHALEILVLSTDSLSCKVQGGKQTPAFIRCMEKQHIYRSRELRKKVLLHECAGYRRHLTLPMPRHVDENAPASPVIPCEGSDDETRGVCDVVGVTRVYFVCILRLSFQRRTSIVDQHGALFPCFHTVHEPSDTLIFKICFRDTVRDAGHKRCDTRPVVIWRKGGV